MKKTKFISFLSLLVLATACGKAAQNGDPSLTSTVNDNDSAADVRFNELPALDSKVATLMAGDYPKVSDSQNIAVLDQSTHSGLGVLYQSQFSSKQFLAIPSSIALSFTSGSLVPSVLTLTLYNADASDSVCTYQNPALSGATYSYSFSNCTQSSTSLGTSAYDSVTADSLSLKFQNPVSTQVTQISFNLNGLTSACHAGFAGNMHLLGPVSCPSSTGVILSNINPAYGTMTFDGHGFSLSAPQATVGLYLQGMNLKVKNLIIDGLTNGIGILTYNTNNLTIQSSECASNSIGIQVYSDTNASYGSVFTQNKLSSNSMFGLRFTGSVYSNNPTITNNDFSQSGGYALAIYGDGLNMSDSQANIYTGSSSGLYLSGGNFNLSNLNLSGAQIKQTPVFATDAYITINNSNLTPSSVADSTQQRIGLHLYKIKTANISQLQVVGADVAIKIATDSGVASSVSVTNSTLTQSIVAGFMIQSYDGSGFGSINIQNNDLRQNPSNMAIWSAPYAGHSGSYVSNSSNNLT